MSVDLTTTYLGLTLRNPLVAGPSPATDGVDSLRRLEDAGIAAVVLPSLFEEQIEHEAQEILRLHEFGTEAFAEARDWFPHLDDYNTGPDGYLERLEKARRSLGIPVIASLNGHTTGGWVQHARLMERAGADAIELNIYFVPIDPDQTAEQVETRYLELVTAVREAVAIPIAVKIGPCFTALPHMARRLFGAGADGLVLFNRLLEPDMDLDRLEYAPRMHLSTSRELGLPLRWIAILKDRVPFSLAATTGVHTTDDVLKLLLAGADVAMLASSLLKQGYPHVRSLLVGITQWMTERDYSSVTQLKGSMCRSRCPHPEHIDRANYMKALTSFTPNRGWESER